MAIKGAPQKQVSKPITAKQRANIELIKRGKIQEPIYIFSGSAVSSPDGSWWTNPEVLVSRETFDARVAQEFDRMSRSSFGRAARVISAADSEASTIGGI